MPNWAINHTQAQSCIALWQNLSYPCHLCPQNNNPWRLPVSRTCLSLTNELQHWQLSTVCVGGGALNLALKTRHLGIEGIEGIPAGVGPGVQNHKLARTVDNLWIFKSTRSETGASEFLSEGHLRCVCSQRRHQDSSQSLSWKQRFTRKVRCIEFYLQTLFSWCYLTDYQNSHRSSASWFTSRQTSLSKVRRNDRSLTPSLMSAVIPRVWRKLSQIRFATEEGDAKWYLRVQSHLPRTALNLQIPENRK